MKELALLAGLAITGFPARAADDASLELVAMIPMPHVKGRIDHFAVDLRGHRLFVAGLGNDSVEVLDTAQSRHLRSLSGFGEPQGLLYLATNERLYIANGSSDRLDILDAQAFSPVHRVSKLHDADNIRYDAAAHKVVVGYGGGALRLLDPDTADGMDIPLPGHPESFQLEESGVRAFVNVPGARQIAVVDRTTRKVVATWDVPARANFPMALDEEGRRLFVGARSPSVMLIYDIDSGKVVAKLGIGGDSDDIFFDQERKRVYVICGDGEVDIFQRQGADGYIHAGRVKSAPRARTGLFVPAESRLYVAAPAAGASPARVLVYAVR